LGWSFVGKWRASCQNRDKSKQQSFLRRLVKGAELLEGQTKGAKLLKKQSKSAGILKEAS
jgi:ABC-type sulfate transport system substrate-binding protein